MRRVLVLIALTCVLAPAGALADSTASGGRRLIKDCATDGQIDGHYTQAQYKYALDHLPSDLDEYTNCRDAIKAAQAGAARGRGHGGGGGGGGFGGGLGGPSVPSSPAPPGGGAPGPSPAIANAGKTPVGPVNIGGGPPVAPGGPGITASSVGHALPGAVLVALVLLGLATLGASSLAVRSRVLARRHP